MPSAFVFGFILDSLTLQRIDLWFENLVFIVHLFILCVAIFLINAHESERFFRFLIPQKLVSFLMFVMQFSFGALFSAFFIFYSRSASLASSWPFLLFLLLMLFGNEVFRKSYGRLVFQLSLFFIILFSYSIFIVPVVLGKIGVDIFILSGIVSLVFIGIFIFILSSLIKEKLAKVKSLLTFFILLIFAVFNVFYFTNIIPPIPLSLKEIGVYHSVLRNKEGGYIAMRENVPWYRVEKLFGSKVHWVSGGSVYVYSAVFAPTRINTKIYHEWEHYDGKSEEWVTTNKIGFPIVGGRDGGYRGYTTKESIVSGKWRVNVITERGQIIGRKTFEVIESDTTPELEATAF